MSDRYYLFTAASDGYEGPFGEIEEFSTEEEALDAGISFKDHTGRDEYRGFAIIQGVIILDER